MDNTTGITPVMPVGGGMGDGFGGGFWIFALLILLLIGGNGGGLFGNGNNNAIQNDVNRGFDNQNSMANQRDILNAVNAGTAQAVAATNQTFHDTLGIVQNRYDELARDISGVAVAQAQALANQNMCCCETKQLIMQTSAATDAAIAQNRYDTAMGLAGLEQRIMAKMDQNTIQNLRDQVDALRDQVNMSGVLRFPNSWTYGAGQFPPIFGCNGYNNI